MTAPAPLRLSTGSLTVLLGDIDARSAVLASLDEATARCAGGHGVPGAARLRLDPWATAGERVALVEAHTGLAVVLADRPTAGLSGADRRAVLRALRALAATGTAVLVDDVDPVAALAVADAALRVRADGALSVEDLAVPAA
jgi:hypothetical protein